MALGEQYFDELAGGRPTDLGLALIGQNRNNWARVAKAMEAELAPHVHLVQATYITITELKNAVGAMYASPVCCPAVEMPQIVSGMYTSVLPYLEGYGMCLEVLRPAVPSEWFETIRSSALGKLRELETMHKTYLDIARELATKTAPAAAVQACQE